MPFAVVMGKTLTEFPKDLYIPPQALAVFLEAFEGPLDLLLYLIKRQNLDILESTFPYHRAIHGIRGADGRDAVRAGGGIPADGRHAGGDQIAHAAAARQ